MPQSHGTKEHAGAERLQQPSWELGHFELRGFATKQRLFALIPESG